MVPHAELALGQAKLNQWQPAETNQMRVVQDFSHFFDSLSAAVRLCRNLDPVMTISP